MSCQAGCKGAAYIYTSLPDLFYLHSQAGAVLSRFKGCPLSIRVIRWRAHDGTVYRPLIKFLRALRTENPTLQLGPAPSQETASRDQKPPPSQCLKEGRQVLTRHRCDLYSSCHHDVTFEKYILNNLCSTGLFT